MSTCILATQTIFKDPPAFNITPCLYPNLTRSRRWPSSSHWRSGREIQQPALLQAPKPSLSKASYFLTPKFFTFSISSTPLSKRAGPPDLPAPLNASFSETLPSRFLPKPPSRSFPYRYCPPPWNHKPCRVFFLTVPGGLNSLTLKNETGIHTTTVIKDHPFGYSLFGHIML